MSILKKIGDLITRREPEERAPNQIGDCTLCDDTGWVLCGCAGSGMCSCANYGEKRCPNGCEET